MIYASDSQSQWIRELLTSVDVGNIQQVGVSVSSCVPAIYDMYVKILHGVEANFTYLDNPLTLPEEEVLRFSDCEPIRSLVAALKNQPTRRLRWTEVAQALSLPYTAEFSWEWCHRRLKIGCWPRYISGPSDGVLDPHEASRLIQLLRPFTGDQSVTCRLAEMSVTDIGTAVLYERSLQAVLDVIQQPGYSDLPEYWWPKDRCWCVVSDYDLTFTLVGGSRDLCAALLQDDYLECIEVLPSTRVDSYTPIPIGWCTA